MQRPVFANDPVKGHPIFVNRFNVYSDFLPCVVRAMNYFGTNGVRDQVLTRVPRHFVLAEDRENVLRSKGSWNGPLQRAVVRHCDAVHRLSV